MLNDPGNFVDPFGLEVGLPGESNFWSPGSIGMPDFSPTQIVGGFITVTGAVIMVGGGVITVAILSGEHALAIPSVGMSLAMISHTIAIGGTIIGIGRTFTVIGWNMFNEDKDNPNEGGPCDQ